MAERKSTQITNIDASDFVSTNELGGRERIAKFDYTVATVAVGDTVLLTKIPAGARFVGGAIDFEDLGTSVALDLGIKGADGSGYIDQADSVADDPDYFLDGIDVSSAGQDTVAELAQGDSNALSTIDKSCYLYATNTAASNAWTDDAVIKGVLKYVVD